MNKTEKMAPVLNLAKLVRFQRTNQARRDPIYDASLYVFSHNDMMGREVDCPNQPANKKQFTHEYFFLRLISILFLIKQI